MGFLVFLRLEMSHVPPPKLHMKMKPLLSWRHFTFSEGQEKKKKVLVCVWGEIPLENTIEINTYFNND